jgi:serine/threonine protein kinase/tetratricopeptide (TPR) repeat protein
MPNKFDIDRERWLAASPFLEQALDLPTPQRSLWLQQLESQSPDIAADVVRLLAAETRDEFRSFLNVPLDSVSPGTAPFPQPGELIGNYRVIEEIGRGGMAVVYLAERADGLFEQRVALKLLRFGSVANIGKRHFDQERQILASLNHPGIARLIDGGVTPTGVPYLTMEYVRGVTLDRHCDIHKLSLEERLRLFLQVTEAVHYAHQHLIVHRDLKPSNIVVDAEGAVKLLDFGIAKLLNADAKSSPAAATRDIGTLMTPEYASPEQARGEAVTTATDVYQLGLLLYELLTGRAPYDLNGRSTVDALRTVCEVEPVSPSVALAQNPAASDAVAKSLATIAAERATTPSRLSRTLRGDLDAIVLMALRKEPERRYSSVASLRDDIVRYLRGRPVSAYRGIWLYRTGKFVRRHAVSVAISAISACALVAVTFWYTTQLAQERDNAAMEAARARQEAAFSRQISEFLTSVFRGSNSRVAKSDTTARELLERGAARIETELAGQPALQGRLLTVIGDTYAQYELNDKAQPLLERALLQNTRLFGANSNEAADSKLGLARVARNRGEMTKAQQLLQEVLVVREQTLGPRHITSADALHELSYIYYRLGAAKEAVQSAERAIDIYTASLPENDARILSALSNYALALSNAGEYERARAQLEALVPRMEHALGPNDPRLASALSNLANMRVELDDFEGVESLMMRAAAIDERLYGPHHNNVIINRLNLAGFYSDVGRFGAAIPVLEQLISDQQRNQGPRHEFEGTAQSFLGRALHSRGDFKQAVAAHRAALDIYRDALGTSHWRYGLTLREYGELQMDLGELGPATVKLSQALAIARADVEGEQFHIAASLVSLGQLYARTNEGSRCESHVREALDLYRKMFPQGNLLIATAQGALGECLLAQHQLADAEPLLRDSIERLDDRYCVQRRHFLESLVKLYDLKNDSKSARDTQARLLAFSKQLRSQ